MVRFEFEIQRFLLPQQSFYGAHSVRNKLLPLHDQLPVFPKRTALYWQ
ncbi:Hypothetical protein NGAL_HAMBI2427_56680 [Neorhizobium galegae bv. orientalis]|nr:Hypothetical protein NGAL_HAMBI2427_56680 [Neorhizobium galegae bv. orientalis]